MDFVIILSFIIQFHIILLKEKIKFLQKNQHQFSKLRNRKNVKFNDKRKKIING